MPVARFRDYRRAIAAARRLVADGHDPQDVAIIATGFLSQRSKPAESFWTRVGHFTVSALIAVACTLSVLEVLPGVHLEGPILLLTLSALLAAAASALVAGLLLQNKGFFVARLVPTTYEVTCDADADDASRELAKWWDSEITGAPQTPLGRQLAGPSQGRHTRGR